jgi:tetratricopeptide (TPR) repeat protein
MVADQDEQPDPADQIATKAGLDSAEAQWGHWADLATCRSVFMFDDMETYLGVIDALTARLAADPENLVAYNNRALAYDEIGEVDKAEIDYKEAVRPVSDDPRPLKNFGMFLVNRRGDIDAATKLYERALSMSPADDTLYRCMGTPWSRASGTGRRSRSSRRLSSSIRHSRGRIASVRMHSRSWAGASRPWPTG